GYARASRIVLPPVPHPTSATVAPSASLAGTPGSAESHASSRPATPTTARPSARPQPGAILPVTRRRSHPAIALPTALFRPAPRGGPACATTTGGTATTDHRAPGSLLAPRTSGMTCGFVSVEAPDRPYQDSQTGASTPAARAGRRGGGGRYPGWSSSSGRGPARPSGDGSGSTPRGSRGSRTLPPAS